MADVLASHVGMCRNGFTLVVLWSVRYAKDRQGSLFRHGLALMMLGFLMGTRLSFFHSHLRWYLYGTAYGRGLADGAG